MRTVVIGRNVDIRNAICGAIEEFFDFEVHLIDYQKSNCKKEIEWLSKAGIIILDLTTIGVNARLFVREVREAFPESKIIALHIYKEADYVKLLMDAGASAYLFIDSLRSEMEMAIIALRNGEQYVSKEVM
jgi:DNA-binding NarL/FixJ family response regulator